MKTVLAEFSGRRAGYFREKPIFKIGGHKPCPLCGEYGLRKRGIDPVSLLSPEMKKEREKLIRNE